MSLRSRSSDGLDGLWSNSSNNVLELVSLNLSELSGGLDSKFVDLLDVIDLRLVSLLEKKKLVVLLDLLCLCDFLSSVELVLIVDLVSFSLGFGFGDRLTSGSDSLGLSLLSFKINLVLLVFDLRFESKYLEFAILLLLELLG